MFPEYRELISKLKNNDLRFQKLFDLHNELDQKIKNIESGITVDTSETIDELKKQKLKLKDEIYDILRKTNDNHLKL
ncbi:YdcH family protein [Gilliamella sp. B2776]|uniref:YdcH family protein n=1 Tax=unclassified Gilliamella TaxID=2685620 RepID=UPI00226A8A4E|nr:MULTISPECIES: YdcH family protein [unclassified Gilliamella]MCX8649695.1 YdcH family protein [Gilliamella sp. B2779]MCX8654054.1 YdcH family protein [Gilliamella sp. B2737]MCX8657299.1 YdcH family protein [Gilliamella sp. B2894]MCX8665081.1 YdcH family protein [Gilliamella sp. B2887]MCX8691315.1 YdcH family protein [Gilliamella sp. B2776]